MTTRTSRPSVAKAMGLLLVLLLAAVSVPELAAAQPVTAAVKDDGAEAVSEAIQRAISEQDGKTAAQLIAQAIAAHAKPSLGLVVKPQQKAQTPAVVPEESNTSPTAATSGPNDDVEYPYEVDGTEKFAQAFADGGLPTGRRLLRAGSGTALDTSGHNNRPHMPCGSADPVALCRATV